VIDNTDFSRKILELETKGARFSPYVFLDPDGDTVEFVASPDTYHAERLDDFLTVYISEERDCVVGALLKDIRARMKRICDVLPGFKFELDDGKVRLEAIIRAHGWTSRHDPKSYDIRLFKSLTKMVRENKAAEVEFAEPLG